MYAETRFGKRDLPSTLFIEDDVELKAKGSKLLEGIHEYRAWIHDNGK